MASKIYYGLGIGIIALYLLLNLQGMRSGGAPQARPLGVIRINKGKYVPVAPSYSSGGSSSSRDDDKSSGRYRSYPSGGDYSGGK